MSSWWVLEFRELRTRIGVEILNIYFQTWGIVVRLFVYMCLIKIYDLF